MDYVSRVMNWCINAASKLMFLKFRYENTHIGCSMSFIFIFFKLRWKSKRAVLKEKEGDCADSSEWIHSVYFPLTGRTWVLVRRPKIKKTFELELLEWKKVCTKKDIHKGITLSTSFADLRAPSDCCWGESTKTEGPAGFTSSSNLRHFQSCSLVTPYSYVINLHFSLTVLYLFGLNPNLKGIEEGCPKQDTPRTILGSCVTYFIA